MSILGPTHSRSAFGNIWLEQRFLILTGFHIRTSGDWWVSLAWQCAASGINFAKCQVMTMMMRMRMITMTSTKITTTTMIMIQYHDHSNWWCCRWRGRRSIGDRHRWSKLQLVENSYWKAFSAALACGGGERAKFDHICIGPGFY